MSGPPTLLYHYTGIDGLIGILTTGCLRATDAEFLNDAQELRFGREELCSALDERAQQLLLLEQQPDSSYGASSRAAVIHSCVDFLRADHCDANNDRSEHQVFVACFCEQGDLLSQWRSYGANGGYAIGFRSQELNDLSTSDSGNFESGRRRLVKVNYGRNAQTIMIEQVLDRIAPNPVGHPGAHGWAAGVFLALPALAGVKDAAFSEEKEWRLLQGSNVPDQTIKFRAGRYAVTPYIDMTFGRTRGIAEVWVGPGINTDLRVLGVTRLLAELGMQQTLVHKSGAPFRG